MSYTQATLTETIYDLAAYMERGARMDPVAVAWASVDLLGEAHPVAVELLRWTKNKDPKLPEELCDATLSALREHKRRTAGRGAG